ncbi:MAG: asparagine synthase-related protein, partial [Bryobacteraceae bacterium]
DEACEKLDCLLQSSIAEHLVSDVPIGIWASGGLDSSTILHYAAQSSRVPLDSTGTACAMADDQSMEIAATKRPGAQSCPYRCV